MELQSLPYGLNFFKNVSMEEKIFTAYKTNQQNCYSNFIKNTRELVRKRQNPLKKKWAKDMNRNSPEETLKGPVNIQRKPDLLCIQENASENQ